MSLGWATCAFIFCDTEWTHVDHGLHHDHSAKCNIHSVIVQVTFNKHTQSAQHPRPRHPIFDTEVFVPFPEVFKGLRYWSAKSSFPFPNSSNVLYFRETMRMRILYLNAGAYARSELQHIAITVHLLVFPDSTVHTPSYPLVSTRMVSTDPMTHTKYEFYLHTRSIDFCETALFLGNRNMTAGLNE